jgi:hypothetical protein
MHRVTYPPSTYRAFILRMWVEADDLAQSLTESPWRFSLEVIGGQDETPSERRGFASAEALLAYLQDLSRAIGADKSIFQEAKR